MHSRRTTGTRLLTFAVTAFGLMLALGGGEAWAQRLCVATAPFCPNVDVTVSTIQIGGQGSLSSNGSGFSNPGLLDDGTIAEADLVFTFTRSTGILTVQAINRTTSTASLTGFSFNTPTGVTGMSLVSHNGALPWELAFDSDRLDNVVDSHPSPNLKYLKMDGMGAFNVLIANKGIDTGPGGGDPTEILAGNSVTFTIQVSGSTSSLTACSFTSLPSVIPPGDKITIAVGRFQAGVQGGSGFISPCDPGDLLVTLSSFDVEPGDGHSRVRWQTSSEVDNAGFSVLRKGERSGVFERVTGEALIPGEGSPVSGFSYEFVDRSAVNGVKYLYMLEDFDLNGINTIHPSKRAVPNPPSPPIQLLEPAYEATAASVVIMRWATEQRVPVSIQISADPTFPAESTLVLAGGPRSAKRLTPRERETVLGLAAAGEGGVYWKVTGRSPRGTEIESQVWFLVLER